MPCHPRDAVVDHSMSSRRDFALRALAGRSRSDTSVSETPKIGAVRPLRWVALLGLLVGLCLLTLGAGPASADESPGQPTEQTAPESTTTTTVVAEPRRSDDTASAPAETAPPPPRRPRRPTRPPSVAPSQLLTGRPSNTATADGAAPIVITRQQRPEGRPRPQPVGGRAPTPLVGPRRRRPRCRPSSSNGTPVSRRRRSPPAPRRTVRRHHRRRPAAGHPPRRLAGPPPQRLRPSASPPPSCWPATTPATAPAASGVTFTRDGRCRTVSNSDLTDLLLIVIGRNCDADGHSQSAPSQSSSSTVVAIGGNVLLLAPVALAATQRASASRSVATPTARQSAAPAAATPTTSASPSARPDTANGIAVGGDHQGGTAGSANSLTLAIGGGDATGTAVGGTSRGFGGASGGNGGSANVSRQSNSKKQ